MMVTPPTHGTGCVGWIAHPHGTGCVGWTAHPHGLVAHIVSDIFGTPYFLWVVPPHVCCGVVLPVVWYVLFPRSVTY